MKLAWHHALRAIWMLPHCCSMSPPWFQSKMNVCPLWLCLLVELLEPPPDHHCRAARQLCCELQPGALMPSQTTSSNTKHGVSIAAEPPRSAHPNCPQF
eukprot:3846110-Amphidinium_carterae.1